MFSSLSYAGWTKIGTSEHGNTFYVDFERIRKHEGYVYWWELTDYLKPNEIGRLSAIVYIQGDCKRLRYKFLSDSYHDKPMGGGKRMSSSNIPDKEWRYPSPNSVSEFVQKSVCSR